MIIYSNFSYTVDISFVPVMQMYRAGLRRCGSP
jgi:hypothetical protein